MTVWQWIGVAALVGGMGIFRWGDRTLPYTLVLLAAMAIGVTFTGLAAQVEAARGWAAEKGSPIVEAAQ